MKQCPHCRTKPSYKKGSSYDDLWYVWEGGSDTVDIRCPNSKTYCWNFTIHTEKLSPKRYQLAFGKNKGKRLNQVDDGYIEWLRESSSSKENPDPFLAAILALI